MTIKIACLQMNSGNRVADNLEFIDQQLAIAASEGVKLVQLPENFAQMPASSAEQVSEAFGRGEIQSFLKRAAKEFQLAIVAGAMPIRGAQESGQNPKARCLVYDADGDLLCWYDKIHLFNVDLPNGQSYRESDRFTEAAEPGENIVVESVAGVRLGLSICYDLRFPELYRMHAAQNAELLSVPSAFTYETGEAHWRTLLTARAIENVCYLFAAAQTGEHASGRHTWGHSIIIDPWGRILAQANDQPGLISADIDLTVLKRLRARFPALEHRRL